MYFGCLGSSLQLRLALVVVHGLLIAVVLQSMVSRVDGLGRHGTQF